MVVDLPAPLGPRKPVTRPGRTLKVSWSTARRPPYSLPRSRTSMLVMATALPFGGVGASPAGGDHLPRAREARCRCRLRGWRHGPLPAPASARDDVHAPAASVGADADGQRLAVHRPVGPLGARAGTRPARTRARGPQGRGRAGASAAHARRGGSGYLRGAVGDLAGPAAHAALAGAAD